MKPYSYYSKVEVRKVDWLWYPYVPYGKITLLQGDPGEGKSTFMIQLLAILTRAGVLPDGTLLQRPETVIYQCAEDNRADTVKPRLLAAGADCDRVVFVDDAETSVTLDDTRLEDTIRETGARLLILDPIQAFIPSDVDMQSASKMRSVMRCLASLAERYGCAIVLVGHMNKSEGGKHLYRSLGSIDIAAIARSVLMIKREETDEKIRYMFPVKSSLAPEGSAIAFLLHPYYGFQWIGRYVPERESPCEQAVEPECGKKEQVVRFIHMFLAEQDLPSVEVYRRLANMNVSQRTIKSASKEAGVITYRKGGAWHWSLKKQESEDE